MRKLLLIGTCFLSLSLLGNSNTDAAPDFRSLYEGYANAVREMNVDEYMGYFADDFRLTMPDGRELNRAELIDAQRGLAKAIHVNAFDVTLQSVTPLAKGDFDVVVLQEFDRDQRTGNEPTINVYNSVVRHEIWRNTASGWKILRVEDVLSGPTVRRLRRWL